MFEARGVGWFMQWCWALYEFDHPLANGIGFEPASGTYSKSNSRIDD